MLAFTSLSVFPATLVRAQSSLLTYSPITLTSTCSTYYLTDGQLQLGATYTAYLSTSTSTSSTDDGGCSLEVQTNYPCRGTGVSLRFFK